MLKRNLRGSWGALGGSWSSKMVDIPGTPGSNLDPTGHPVTHFIRYKALTVYLNTSKTLKALLGTWANFDLTDVPKVFIYFSCIFEACWLPSLAPEGQLGANLEPTGANLGQLGANLEPT